MKNSCFFVGIIFIILVFPFYFFSATGFNSSDFSNETSMKSLISTENTIFNSSVYVNQEFYISSNISISGNISFMDCSFNFLFNVSNELSLGFSISNQAILSFSNTGINFIISNITNSVTDHFFIYGGFQSQFSFYGSTISKSSVISRLLSQNSSIDYSINFDQATSVKFNYSAIDDSTNVFNFTNTHSVQISNSRFDNISSSSFIFNSSISVQFDNDIFTSEFNSPNSSIIIQDSNATFKNVVISPFQNINTFSTSSFHPGYIINLLGTSSCIFSNNSIYSSSHIFFIDPSARIFVYNSSFEFSSNIFSSTGIPRMIILQNDFINSTDIFSFNSFQENPEIICSLNNFIYSNSLVNIIDQSNQNIKFDFSYNFYSNFHSIDFNSDGFYDRPYETKFFIDMNPLVYPSQNYTSFNGIIALKDSSVYVNNQSILPLSSLTSQWFSFSFYYILIFVALVLLVFISRKVGHKHLNK